MYKANKIRNIAMFFKDVDPRQLHDPGKQLETVLAFKKRIEDGKQYLFKEYEALDQFAEILEGHLPQWLKDHESPASSLSVGGMVTGDVSTGSSKKTQSAVVQPGWIAAANRLSKDDAPDNAGASFCALKAMAAAKSDIEWAQVRHVAGIIQFNLGQYAEAIAAFSKIAGRFSASLDPDRHAWETKALVSKMAVLCVLGRTDETIAVSDDVLARFGTAAEPALRERVAGALFFKGAMLGTLGRNDEAIAVFDDVMARFGTATELALREQVADALVNKGERLGALGRSEEEIAVYDNVLARFGTAARSAAERRQLRSITIF